MLDPTNYAAIGWVLVSLGAIAGIINQFDSLLKRNTSKPPAGELMLSTTQLAERVSRLEEAYARLPEQIRESHTDIVAEGDQRRRAIYDKIDELRRETKEDLQVIRTELTAELRDYNALNEKRVAAIHDRINQILATVAELAGRTTQ